MKKKKTKKIITIGIDIDNVISDSYPSYIEKYNQQFNAQIRIEEVVDFYYLNNLSQQNGGKVVTYIDQLTIDQEFQISLPPVSMATETIGKWYEKGYKIHFITSRPIEVRDITHMWLKKHNFWHPKTLLDLWDEKKNYPSDVHYKKDMVDKNNIDLFIEDNKEIAENMKIPVFLLDKPWNKGKLPKNVKRVKNWFQIENEVKKLR